MAKKNSAADIAVFFIIGSLYSWSLMANLLSTTVLSVHAFDIFLITVMFILVFYIVFYNRITILICIGVLLAVFLYFLYFAFFVEKLPEHMIKFYDYLSGMVLFVRGYAQHGRDYSYFIVIILALLITLYTTFFTLVTFSFFSLAGLGIVLFSVSWITGYESSLPIYMVFLFSFIVLLVKKLNMTNTEESNGRFALTVMPVCALLMTVAFVLPIPQNAGSADISTLSEAIQRPYYFINDIIYEAFNAKYFTLHGSGFTGEDGRLGGKVNMNDRYVMSVYSDSKVYLAGAVRDTYTGYSWTNSEPGFYVSEISEYGENVLADITYDTLFDEGGLILYTEEPEFTELKYMPVRSVTVDIGTNRTGTVFRPVGTFSLGFEEPYEVQTNIHNDIRTSRLLRPNTRYTALYLDPSYGGYEILEESVNSENNDGYANFLQLPESLTERVYTLTKNITYGIGDNYSKIKQIEAFLHMYDYNLSPENPPLDADFVDYFLFDGKEGYCTYYASAMVVMSRIIGMPARYVEGYMTPERRDSKGAYIVTNRQAHAWAEVFFEGFGWVAFEPTAPFSLSFYASENRASPYIGSILYEEEELDYFDEMGWAALINMPQAGEELPQEEENTDPFNFYLRILMLLGAVAVVLFFIAFVNSIRMEIFNFKLKRLKNGERACEYFKKMLDIAAVLGFAINDNETAQRYGKRVGKTFSFQNEKYFFDDVIKIFSKSKYGNKQISDTEIDFVSDAYNEMLTKAAKKLKIYQYVFFRYILYKF